MRPFIFLLALLLVDVVSSLNKTQDCKCRTQRKPRIIGGHKANSMYPWVVSLQHKERWFWWLTAKENKAVRLHFVEKQAKDSFHVAYGNDDLVTIYERNHYAEVEAVYTHPNYVPDAHAPLNDIALILLGQPLNFNETVQPACLPSHHYLDKYDGALRVVGFGARTQWSEMWSINLSRYMSEGNTYDVSQDPRASTHGGLRCRNATEICVGNLMDPNVGNQTFSSIPCNGDSDDQSQLIDFCPTTGGPLHQTKSGRTTVIGLASYGDEKAEAGLTIHCVGITAYTRVSAFIDWIRKTVGNEICV